MADRTALEEQMKLGAVRDKISRKTLTKAKEKVGLLEK